ncbi:MAG TPA: sulfatase [Thermoanaerobaculia bacterium]|nr:sulfatase [Thermoanaerobaculia bacterium]
MPHTRVLLLILAIAALTGTLACTTHEPEAATPAIAPLPAGSNILLITVDTLRADHLSSYGYVRPTSPVIDRLAAEGVRFDQAQVQWPKTTPSFASIFTASYAKDNQIVRTAGQPVPCKFSMLAEMLHRQGYATAAVVANAAVGSDFYFDQGFDEFIETWKLHESQKGADPNRAEAVTNLAIGQLDRLKASGKPYFLWVHYLDPHAPYEPPAPYRDRFQNDEHFDPAVRILLSDKPKQQMFGIGSERVLDGRDELAFYVARYDAEIAYTDEQIGRLLDEMKMRGLLQKTLTAFTADHGESLGDHGYYFDHGRFSFQTCLHVPLVLHYPGVLNPRVDKDPVELIHLAPTLLEAAGAKLENGGWMQGRTLTARLRGQADPPGLAFAEAGWETNNKWQKVARDGKYKLIFAQTRPEQRWIGGEGVRFALYDLANDPGETKNVVDQFSQEAERLKRELWKWDRAPRVNVETDAQGGTCGEQRAVSKETEDLLRSLGYL